MPIPQSSRNHPLKPEQREGEDYVDYLGRCGDFWALTPPPAPLGFELVECTATPRHWPEYAPHDDDFYSGGCSRCIIADQAEVLRAWQCKAEHHRWQTWRITARFARWAYSAGVIAGSGTSYGGCETHPKRTTLYWRGKRSYILGVSRNAWRCLLKYHHLRGEHVGLGFCGKCLPCPTCDSTTAGHEPGCSEVS